jgi:hypothetical protein
VVMRAIGAPEGDVVRVRCVRAPVWPQVLCAAPAAIWISYTFITGTWLRVPIVATLPRALAAAATPPIAFWLLRLLYNGRGILTPGPILVRLGRRAIRDVEIADGSAFVDTGRDGAFVVTPVPAWLQPFGSSRWESTVPVRWILSGAAALILAAFAALEYTVALLGYLGVVLQFVLGPIAVVFMPAILVVNLVGLWPVSRRVGPPRATIISSGPAPEP